MYPAFIHAYVDCSRKLVLNFGNGCNSNEHLLVLVCFFFRTTHSLPFLLSFCGAYVLCANYFIHSVIF